MSLYKPFPTNFYVNKITSCSLLCSYNIEIDTHIMILLIFVSSLFISIKLIRPWLTSDIKHFNFCFVCVYVCVYTLHMCVCIYVCVYTLHMWVCVLALNSYTLPLKISLQFIPKFWDIGVNWWMISAQQNMNFNLCLRVLFHFRWFSFSFLSLFHHWNIEIGIMLCMILIESFIWFIKCERITYIIDECWFIKLHFKIEKFLEYLNTLSLIS